MLEVVGPQMVAPYFGFSLQTWTSMLVITLFALALGYYTGGFLSKKKEPLSILSIVFPITSVWIFFWSLRYKNLISNFINIEPVLGATIVLILITGIPIYLMGCVSPLIIQVISKEMKAAGEISGIIFAISTIGSIFGGALTGYVLLSLIGVKKVCILASIILIICSGLLFYLNKKRVIFGVLILILCILLGFYLKEEKLPSNVLFRRSSPLGEVSVLIHQEMQHNKIVQLRMLAVNGLPQTIVFDEGNRDSSVWDYVKWIDLLSSGIKKKDKEALVIGMGGGTVPKRLYKKGFKVKVVEIDPIVVEAAKKFFYFPDSIEVLIEDAAVFLEREKKKYDFILLDIFIAEHPPTWVLTKEKFSKVFGLISNEGILLLNFYGFYSGEEGRATKSIYSTICDAGKCPIVISTKPNFELYSNNLFAVSFFDFFAFSFDTFLVKNWRENILDTSGWYSKFDVLTEDKNTLAKEIITAGKKWRMEGLNYYLRSLLLREIR